MSNFDLSGYKTVPQRLAEFRSAYPNGRLAAANPARPYYVETIGSQTYVIYAAAAYRTPDDQCPGIGIAWEPVPGLTPYTKNSEIQNAETSAWGRAVVAALIVDPGQSVASRDDIEKAQQSQGGPERATTDDVDEIEDAMAQLDDMQRAELRQWWKIREYGSLRPRNPQRKLLASDVEAVLDEIHRLINEPTESWGAPNQ